MENMVVLYSSIDYSYWFKKKGSCYEFVSASSFDDEGLLH